MGLAIDTLLVEKNTPGATLTGMTPVAGNTDSLTVRSFPETSRAWLHHVIRRHNATGAIRVMSPLLHDNVTGLTWNTAETPSVHLFPSGMAQRLYRGDALTVQISGDTTHDSVAALGIYYEDLDGAAAKLYQPGDILGNIASVKALEVDCTTSATVGLWSDTAINTTDKQLHSDSQYAVIGFTTDTALACVGIKGQSTGNLRICGPGTTGPEDTTSWFYDMAIRHGVPYIPVFAGIDQGAVFVSTADNAASTAAKITLLLAELVRPLI